MSKFGSLGVEIAKPSRMIIVLPNEDEPLKDEDGNEAYIDFLPGDSEPGRKYDQERSREYLKLGLRRNRAEQRAELESLDNIKLEAERLAVLAAGWHLVDRDRSVIDVPFSRANALELFMAPELGWLRRQAWAYVGNEQNFMQRSSKTSAPSPSTNSGSTDRAEPAAPSATT